MTLTDINNRLEKLKDNPSRENVFDFSFMLLEWMGLTPNVGNKPQLLSPQTQKLKEYLFPAPQTVQPQLYRLTGDNQNIRIRFAVLKKIKKEYISQLVDNDPGLSSYQSFVKGLNQEPNTNGFIPTQPYFIHFVTTPEYKKLVLIFNQGDTKKIVSFRNRLTHTQFTKIIQQWQNIGTKSKPEIADLLWKSLDIKEVNKEFYRQIKERFDALVGIAKIQQPKTDEKDVKQFAVRLIGRYIFCWFLKEKGVIPEKLLSSQTITAHQNDFFQKYLYQLFFNTLNEEVQSRNILKTETALDTMYQNIPYLNGGLFDKHPEDLLFEKLNLNDWLIAFVKVLENFDFTVDESNSQYQQVAIDPEMLGRIFENLLASQNEETSSLANQRKAFGAFYTPREIVDYMVNESLKAHLETRLLPAEPTTVNIVNEPLVAYKGSLFQNIEPQQTQMNLPATNKETEKKHASLKAKIQKLFALDCADNPFDKNETQQVRNALSEVKILDPACGSGAFPMGVLLRLMELRQLVGHGYKNNYELKNEILSRNIYGVDIMPMAVEIARLRAWLSLILEADYKPNDRKNNFGISALPNLDFKFVCANSLIDNGYDAFLKKFDLQLKITGSKLYFLNKEIQQLEKIRNQYFDTKGDQTLKQLLKTEFIEHKNFIKKNFNVEEFKIDEKTGVKKKTKSSTAENYGLKDFLNKIDDWNPFNDSNPSSFFSPAWMFGITEGFDVVIGNPPYVPMESLSSELREEYKKKYQLFHRKYETSVLFIVEGLNKLNTNGVLSFIAPMTWQTGENYSRFRKHILKEKGIISILNLPFDIFEAAYVDTGVYLLSNYTSNFYSVFAFDKKEKNLDLSNIKFEKIGLDKITGPDYKLILDEKIGSINSHFKSEQFTTLGLITKSTQGLSGSRFSKLNDEPNGNKVFPFLEKGNVFNYQLKIDEVFLTDLSDKQSLKQFYEAEPKILIRRIINRQDRLSVCFCDERLVFKKDINPFIPIDNNYSAKYLLAILASTLISKLYIISSSIATKDDFRQTTLSELRKLPIPNISIKQQKPFISRVEKILSLKKQNQDTASLEKEIDVLVYKLYELTYEEVKIIDPGFWLSEAEYENAKFELSE